MKTLGRKSFASFLFVTLNVMRWLLWAVLGLLVLVGIPAYIIDSKIDLEWVSPPPPGVVLWPSLILAVIAILVALLVISRLRLIFHTLINGDPFVPENAVHLRVVWVTLAVWEVLRMVFSSGTFLALSASGQDPHAAGLRGELNINAGLWLAVAVLIVLAEVFREGARLRAEHKLTI